MMEQRTEEWFQARLGKVTASRIADLMAKTKDKSYAATRANYMAQLVCERLTGKPTEGFSSAAMQWGVDQEANARAAYELKTGQIVEETGFVQHPIITEAGASPDGLVGSDGLVEIKCPETKTHIEMLLDPRIPGKYQLQMHWQMACTGRKWCDFVMFDPRMPEHLQMKIVRLERDLEWITTIESEVKKFLTELDVQVTKLKELSNG